MLRPIKRDSHQPWPHTQSPHRGLRCSSGCAPAAQRGDFGLGVTCRCSGCFVPGNRVVGGQGYPKRPGRRLGGGTSRPLWDPHVSPALLPTPNSLRVSDTSPQLLPVMLLKHTTDLLFYLKKNALPQTAPGTGKKEPADHFLFSSPGELGSRDRRPENGRTKSSPRTAPGARGGGPVGPLGNEGGGTGSWHLGCGGRAPRPLGSPAGVALASSIPQVRHCPVSWCPREAPDRTPLGGRRPCSFLPEPTRQAGGEDGEERDSKARKRRERGSSQPVTPTQARSIAMRQFHRVTPVP